MQVAGDASGMLPARHADIWGSCTGYRRQVVMRADGVTYGWLESNSLRPRCSFSVHAAQWVRGATDRSAEHAPHAQTRAHTHTRVLERRRRSYIL
eukprot:7845625-Heterocapsa_arctica.AAC.1